MRTTILVTLLALLLAACTLQESSNYSGDLEIGALVEGKLAKETPDSFKMELDADTYIYGIVDQLSVDVVVTIYDSAENVIRKFDGPGVGPEVFSFEVQEGGNYILEVAPFEEESGEYTIQLKVVEAIATDPEKRIDQLFIPYSGDDVPGGVIGVMKDGKLIFSKAYGMANLTDGIPYTTGTLSNIGSVSKQFTAFAILLLEQQGELSLDDDVRIHIPELPEFDEVITIKNLLNHTNGLREVYNLMPMTGWKSEDGLRREEVIEILKRQKELQASPGEEYNYNNSAFIMLAEIVERKSGQKFPDWMAENVFGPLGMESTVVRADPSTIVPNSSQGYALEASGFKEAGDLAGSYGAGGIYTTAEDFNKWLNNFHDPVLGGEELITRMITPDTLNNGDTMTYALGIGVGEYKGLKRYAHGGADIAHRAMLTYFPEINAGVVTMSNNENFTGQISNEAIDAFFSDELESEENDQENKNDTDSTEVIVPEKLLENYAGKYKISAFGMVLEFTLKDGVLIFSAEGQPDAKMIPKSNTLFAYTGVEATVEFTTDETGKVIQAVHSQGGNKFILEPIAPYDPTQEELKALEGKYLSKELETFYTLEVRDSTLLVLIKNTKEIKLSPLDKDSYKGDVFFISEIKFIRDESGVVDGFTVSNGRTKGILFERF